MSLRRSSLAKLALAMGFSLSAPASAVAQDIVSDEAFRAAPSWDDIARTLMNEGRLGEAAAVVDEQLAAAPNDVQARFLKGMLAIAKGEHRKAIRLFRGILINQPSAGRVRLELARAFYLDKDYGNSLRQFQLALAGHPPARVIANIRTYMAAIRASKTLSYSVGIAIAPDSNLNTGSAAREVTLYGLPFDLSQDARHRSGVGVAAEAIGEWAPPIGPGRRLRLGLSMHRRDYSGTAFDDMSATAYAGPRLTGANWELSLLGTVYRRWYGSKAYNGAIGGRAEGTYYLQSGTSIAVALSAQRIDYRRQRERNGFLLSLDAAAFHALTPSSGVTLKAGVGRQNARLKPYASWSGFAAAGYFRDLPLGFSLYVEPSISLARYDAALPSFGVRRSDTTRSLTVTLLNRHLVLTRFTPRISYSWTRQNSSISLYDFTRSRIEIGVTTVF